ncbi:hypothetical protein [Priestia megaterium]|uniref:hypothetical protein n=1 Tax=Priestia megaterium TaxID=1404 RepID=UPI000CA0E6CA|nr:hypothetical protein [Priestia megaterium]AUO13964.1 hypothetical protein C0569_22570 [Priestia megaterium]RMA95475.1 hypothetical protein DEU44_1641 [Priestia megaterium]
MAQTLSARENSGFRSLLIKAVNSNVEIITPFGSIIGEVVQTGTIFTIPLDYVVLKQSENDFVYIPIASIDSVIINKDGELL